MRIDAHQHFWRYHASDYAHPRLRGVRHVVHDEPDDGFMLREDFARGIGALAAFGLTYDLLLFPRRLPQACDLVARFPEQPFVLDHIAKPPIRLGALGRRPAQAGCLPKRLLQGVGDGHGGGLAGLEAGRPASLS